jgi:murein DD-endopeptidase
MRPACLIAILCLHPAPAAGQACRFRELTVTVQGSLAASLSSLGEDGGPLAAHLARIYMWDLDLRRDVVAGDQIRVLWRKGDTGDPEIGAASYQSQRLGQLLLSYRFRPSGDDYPSYWDPAGLERPRRLKGSPLARYDQITALLKDRPTHQGMDFKTPVGTEVRAPRAGVVTRIDWKMSGNGHCLEVRYGDGTLAKFLHLSSIKVRGGASVRPGQVIALTGNTGHSTAPHLHYQLARGGRTLDPVDYHGVSRRQLGDRDLTGLRGEIRALHRDCGRLGPGGE